VPVIALAENHTQDVAKRRSSRSTAQSHKIKAAPGQARVRSGAALNRRKK